MIRKATMNDLDIIDEVAVLTINDMMKSKIPQWTLTYPRKDHFKKDIEADSLFLFEDKNQVMGAICIKKENDPPYQELTNWLETDSMVIHRLIVHPMYRNKKVAQSFFNFAYELTIKENCKSIKIDTHKENYKMKNFLKKNNFIEIGFLTSINRLAFEKRV